jgi:ABC-type multidrug transport system fused ATPase/permease subunit
VIFLHLIDAFLSGELVLKGVSFRISAGEKVGVAGRTGTVDVVSTSGLTLTVQGLGNLL